MRPLKTTPSFDGVGDSGSLLFPLPPSSVGNGKMVGEGLFLPPERGSREVKKEIDDPPPPPSCTNGREDTFFPFLAALTPRFPACFRQSWPGAVEMMRRFSPPCGRMHSHTELGGAFSPLQCFGRLPDRRGRFKVPSRKQERCKARSAALFPGVRRQGEDGPRLFSPPSKAQWAIRIPAPLFFLSFFVRPWARS